jgi:hypothetical protein
MQPMQKIDPETEQLRTIIDKVPLNFPALAKEDLPKVDFGQLIASLVYNKFLKLDGSSVHVYMVEKRLAVHLDLYDRPEYPGFLWAIFQNHLMDLSGLEMKLRTWLNLNISHVVVFQFDAAFNGTFVFKLNDLLLGPSYSNKSHIDKWLKNDIGCRAVRVQGQNVLIVVVRDYLYVIMKIPDLTSRKRYY